MTRRERFERQLRTGEMIVWCLVSALAGAAIVDTAHLIEDRQRILDTVSQSGVASSEARPENLSIAPVGSTAAGAPFPGPAAAHLLPPAGPRDGWIPTEVSVYAKRYHGRRTASGKRYDHRGLTAATSRNGRRPALPFGSVWEVRHKGRTVRVTITDTGSYRPKRATHWLDLSGAAWEHLTGSQPSRIVAQMRRVK